MHGDSGPAPVKRQLGLGVNWKVCGWPRQGAASPPRAAACGGGPEFLQVRALEQRCEALSGQRGGLAGLRVGRVFLGLLVALRRWLTSGLLATAGGCVCCCAGALVGGRALACAYAVRVAVLAHVRVPQCGHWLPTVCCGRYHMVVILPAEIQQGLRGNHGPLLCSRRAGCASRYGGRLCGGGVRWGSG